MTFYPLIGLLVISYLHYDYLDCYNFDRCALYLMLKVFATYGLVYLTIDQLTQYLLIDFSHMAIVALAMPCGIKDFAPMVNFLLNLRYLMEKTLVMETLYLGINHQSLLPKNNYHIYHFCIFIFLMFPLESFFYLLTLFGDKQEILFSKFLLIVF